MHISILHMVLEVMNPTLAGMNKMTKPHALPDLITLTSANTQLTETSPLPAWWAVLAMSNCSTGFYMFLLRFWASLITNW